MKLRRAPHCRHGTATMVIIVLLAIMSALALATAESLSALKRELRLIEQQQLDRWKQDAARKNPKGP